MKTIEHMPELSEAAARSLRRGGSPEFWAQIVEDIETKRAQLFYVCNDSYLVLQTLPDELLILAYAGCDANMTMEICVEIAKQNKLSSIRFHTSKKGLSRLLKKFKPVEIQRVYRISVDENLY